jgi:putative SOS response-associated peptidase YedK
MLGPMCGRFMQERPVSELAEIFEAEPLADDPGGRYNIAPTDEALVVVQRDDRRAITAYRWGLVPHWAPDAKIAARTFNARAESIASMPAFRDSFRRKRCLVPVDGFYEWRRQERIRQPYRIFRADGRPLVLAGLWDGWKNPETGDIRRTFTIVTTTPNSVVAELHNRMPVIVPDDAWARWLDPRPSEPGELRALLEPTEAVALEIVPASRLVNDVRNDGPELLRAEEEAAAELSFFP